MSGGFHFLPGVGTSLCHQLGDVEDPPLLGVLAHSLRQHQQAEGAGGGDPLGSRVERLSGPHLVDPLSALSAPVVSTAGSTAEALLAVSLLSPGVYVVMHNRTLRFPGVRKDREGLTFRPASK